MTLELRPLNDDDVALMEVWLNKEHVKKWYEIPQQGVTLDDWMHEIRERNGEFSWITHFIAQRQGAPLGFCQYYRCADSDEDYGSIPVAGSYGIDYLIGEESCLGKGLGREMIALLVEKIFTLPDAQRVTADIDETNKASEGVLLSCGFSLAEGQSCRYVLNKSADK